MSISSKASLVLFTCGIVLCLCTVTSAQEWVARYNGPGNGFDGDWSGSIQLDDSGNVYRTGRSTGINTGPDCATIKYSPDGDTIWVRHYNGPGNDHDRGTGLGLDNNGNVYVVGASVGIGSTNDFATIKYSPEGDTIWVRRYNGPGNDRDWPRALAVDDSGSVYITGESLGIGTSNDYTTIKYSPDGDTLWVRRYNGPGNGDDVPSALAVDDSGNVYVTGKSPGIGTQDDFATIKYSPTGDTLWVRRYNGPGNGGDQPAKMVVDSDHNTFVTGGSGGVGGEWDYATIKYSPAGDTLWVRRYNGLGNGFDASVAVTLDTSGNVYVTGRSYGIGTGQDYATIKYSPTGDALWARHYNGPDNLEDWATAVAVAGNGNVYVTGWSVGSVTSEDYATVEYTSAGDMIWLRRYNGPGNGTDDALGLALDDSGFVYVVGPSWGAGTDVDMTTIKYRPCAVFIPGDVNTDGVISAADIICSVNYVFLGGAAPNPCEAAGDVDCTGACDSGDIIYTVNHVFKSGSLPCDVCNSTLASACP